MEDKNINLLDVKTSQPRRRTISVSRRKANEDKQKESTVLSWVKGAIKRKQCIQFQQGKSEEECKCGHSKNLHVDVNSIDGAGGELDDKTGLHVVKPTTDAYGMIEFKGATRNAKAKVKIIDQIFMFYVF